MANQQQHQNHGLNKTMVAMVMVPFPAQGHLNQLLHLLGLILAYNIPVHYDCTFTHNRQALLRVHGWDLKIPPFLTSSPNPNAPHKIIVINDSLMGSVVQDLVTIPNAESYTFHTLELDRYSKIITKDLPSLEGCSTTEFMTFIDSQVKFQKETRTIELSAIGPFNPVRNIGSNKRHKCLEWLDKESPNLVIYVSFGTTTAMEDEQIKELAIGLEKTDKGDVFINGELRKAKILEGFEERIKGRGMVVTDWAPQLEILGHPSISGFMSHCGWNSCMESIIMRVLVAAWPMASDQPRNTVLITKFLKVGIVVKDWSCRDELVTSSIVEKAMKLLMASEEGDEIRQRIVDLGDAIGQSIEEGGVSRMELDSFITHITR
ncbi:hypothetical protein ACB092_09G204200 [Castanea dentata]